MFGLQNWRNTAQWSAVVEVVRRPPHSAQSVWPRSTDLSRWSSESASLAVYEEHTVATELESSHLHLVAQWSQSVLQLPTSLDTSTVSDFCTDSVAEPPCHFRSHCSVRSEAAEENHSRPESAPIRRVQSVFSDHMLWTCPNVRQFKKLYILFILYILYSVPYNYMRILHEHHGVLQCNIKYIRIHCNYLTLNKRVRFGCLHTLKVQQSPLTAVNLGSVPFQLTSLRVGCKGRSGSQRNSDSARIAALSDAKILKTLKLWSSPCAPCVWPWPYQVFLATLGECKILIKQRDQRDTVLYKNKTIWAYDKPSIRTWETLATCKMLQAGTKPIMAASAFETVASHQGKRSTPGGWILDSPHSCAMVHSNTAERRRCAITSTLSHLASMWMGLPSCLLSLCNRSERSYSHLPLLLDTVLGIWHTRVVKPWTTLDTSRDGTKLRV